LIVLAKENEMDRIEKPKQRSEFANQTEVSEADAAALPGTAGRDTGIAAPAEIAASIGARPRSEVTGRHDAGSGANETLDGLNSSQEATRRGAEDTPIGAPEQELKDLPVFDRADALPKV
jgi:hypothetical protein